MERVYGIVVRFRHVRANLIDIRPQCSDLLIDTYSAAR